MKDVLPIIAELLGNVAETRTAFSDSSPTLPCIVISETGNSTEVILGGEERYSIITVQTDVYSASEAQVRSMAVQVSDILAAKGLRRSYSQFITDEDTPRMCMRFRFGLDEKTGRTVSL